MLGFCYRIFLVCIFSFQLLAANDYGPLPEWNEISDFWDLDTEFDPQQPLNIVDEIIRDEHVVENLAEQPAVNFGVQGYSLLRPAQNIVGFIPYYPYSVVPQVIFNAPVISYNCYFLANQAAPELPREIPDFNERKPVSELKRKHEGERASSLKRPKVTEPQKQIAIRRVEREKNNRSPVMRSFLIALEEEKGGYYVNQDKGIFFIYSLRELLDYIIEICSKSRPTDDEGNRIKALQKWIVGIPNGKEKFEKAYTVKIADEISHNKTIKEKYLKFFK